MKEEQKVSFIHSISAKIMLLTVLAVVMSVLIVAFRAEAGTKKVVGDVSADYILSMAEMGGEIVNNLPQEADAGAYENALADISMEGIDSSYAYLVDTDGTMLYHPTAEKIGQPVENAVVLGVVAELAKGQVPVNETVTYDFKGVTKYAAYAITANRQIVVVTADEDEIMEPLNQIISKIMLLSLGILVAAIVLAYVVSQFICRPIQQITTIIGDTAQLDFRSNPNGAKLRSRRDETGEMANAVHVMRRNLRSMIGDIDTASNQITQNVDGLQEITTTVDHMCSDNSATSQQLAAGADGAALPFGVAVHHGADARLADGSLERFGEHLAQFAGIGLGACQVQSAHSLGVPQKVLGGGGHAGAQVVALQALHKCTAHSGTQGRVAAICLIHAAPAQVLGNVQYRR